MYQNVPFFFKKKRAITKIETATLVCRYTNESVFMRVAFAALTEFR